MARYLEMISDGFGAVLREVLLPFQAGADKAQDFSGMVFDFFFRRADAAGG